MMVNAPICNWPSSKESQEVAVDGSRISIKGNSHFVFTSRKRLIWTHSTEPDHFLLPTCLQKAEQKIMCPCGHKQRIRNRIITRSQAIERDNLERSGKTQLTLTNQYSWSHNQWTGFEVNAQNIKHKTPEFPTKEMLLWNGNLTSSKVITDRWSIDQSIRFAFNNSLLAVLQISPIIHRH